MLDVDAGRVKFGGPSVFDGNDELSFAIGLGAAVNDWIGETPEPLVPEKDFFASLDLRNEAKDDAAGVFVAMSSDALLDMVVAGDSFSADRIGGGSLSISSILADLGGEGGSLDFSFLHELDSGGGLYSVPFSGFELLSVFPREGGSPRAPTVLSHSSDRV